MRVVGEEWVSPQADILKEEGKENQLRRLNNIKERIILLNFLMFGIFYYYSIVLLVYLFTYFVLYFKPKLSWDSFIFTIINTKY